MKCVIPRTHNSFGDKRFAVADTHMWTWAVTARHGANPPHAIVQLRSYLSPRLSPLRPNFSATIFTLQFPHPIPLSYPSAPPIPTHALP